MQSCSALNGRNTMASMGRHASRSVSSVTTVLPEMSNAVRLCSRSRQARSPMSDSLLAPAQGQPQA